MQTHLEQAKPKASRVFFPSKCSSFLSLETSGSSSSRLTCVQKGWVSSSGHFILMNTRQKGLMMIYGQILVPPGDFSPAVIVTVKTEAAVKTGDWIS